MSDQNNKTNEIGQIPITEAKPGFESHELAICPACGKSNGPDRRSCIYCGQTLELTELNAAAGKLVLRELEDWEPGVNLIVIPTGECEVHINSAAGILGLDVGLLSDLLEKQTPLPLVRIENAEIADEISAALRELGLNTRIIPDEEIDVERPPIRVRAVEVDESNVRFVDFNTGEKSNFEFAEIILIVSGGLFESRREEVTKRKRGSTKVLDEFEEASDQRVLDIYTSKNSIGFRIQTNGFDFSVLGDNKDLLAAKNIVRLQTYFSTIFPNAAVIDDYDSLRDEIDIVWPAAISKDFSGLQMRGYGKREMGTTYMTSNLLQFTKYSRMRRLLV